MKWLRISMLLFALLYPSGLPICHANPLDDDTIARERERQLREDGDSVIVLSVAGSIVTIALGVSFIALRRIRKRNANQSK